MRRSRSRSRSRSRIRSKPKPTTHHAIATCRRRLTASGKTAHAAKSRCGRHGPRTTSARRSSACTACPTGAQTWATSAVSTRGARGGAARRAGSTPRSGGARGWTRGGAGGWSVAWPRLPASWGGAVEWFRSVVGWACRGWSGQSASSSSSGSRAFGPSARPARPSGAFGLGEHVVATPPG